MTTKKSMQVMRGQQVNRGPVITYDPATQATLYGGPAIACCPPLFDLSCSDGSVGIFCSGGEFELAMRWFGLRRARARHEEVNYLQFMGGIKRTVGDTSLPGVPSEICGRGDCTTWGKECKDVQDCFGLIKICSDPVVDGGNALPYCERDVRVRIDGREIADDAEWHEANMTETLWNTFVYNLFWGYRNTTNQKFGHYGLWSLMGGFTGAEAVRNYVYPCPELKPHVLDWAGNPACSALPMTGITLDGQALAPEFATNLYATIRSILRSLMRQIARTRGLGGTAWRYGDWALMAPAELFDCLIQCAVCFTECAGNCLNLDSERAALMMQELRNGGLGWGELSFDGFKIPLIPFDPTLFEDVNGVVTQTGSLINADGTINALLLYRGSGNQRVMQPEYNDLSDGSWPTRDNGMIQLYEDRSDVCVQPGSRLEWRWSKRAMFFQTLIKNIECNSIMPNCIIDTLAPATNACAPVIP